MGAKGGKHAFYHEERGEKEERPLPGRKHLTRKLTDKRNNSSSSSFHIKGDPGYRYTAAVSPEITEVKLDGMTPYWKIKWPRRTISFQESDDGGQKEFKNLADQEEKTEIINKEDNDDDSGDDDDEMMTQRTVVSDVGEGSQELVSETDGDGDATINQGCIKESFQKEEQSENEESCAAQNDESSSEIGKVAGATCDDRENSSNSEGEESGKIYRKKSLPEVEESNGFWSEFFRNTLRSQCWHYWQHCIPIYLQFSSLRAPTDVSKCEIKNQLVYEDSISRLHSKLD